MGKKAFDYASKAKKQSGMSQNYTAMAITALKMAKVICRMPMIMRL